MLTPHPWHTWYRRYPDGPSSRISLAAVLLFLGLIAGPLLAGNAAQADVRPPTSATAPAELDGSVPGGVQGIESDADLWRRVRGGEAFSLGGATDGNMVLIQSEGDNWRAIRNGPLSTFGGWLLAVAVVAVAGFFAVRGRVRLENRTGRTVPRFTHAERASHWLVASTFILLGISGLILMFGRYVIAPVIGKDAFATLASASLQGHNLFGPIFAVAVVWMFALYVKENLPRREDIIWVVRGGMFFKEHVPTWKFNLGEKGWFWISSLLGFALAGSGLLMDFPWVAETRQQLQLANLVHGAAAVLVIGASFGHMYLGTIGVEGALDGMTTGEVDEAWAKEHHGLWAAELLARDETAKTEGAAE